MTDHEKGPGASHQAVTEVIINTAFAVIQEDATLTLKQPASILNMSEGNTYTILMKK